MLFNFPSASSTSGSIPANKKICVITGTTSGLGKETLRSLLKTDDYFVVCGVRDTDKMEEVAAKENFDKSKFAIVELDLGKSRIFLPLFILHSLIVIDDVSASFDSTRQFVTKLNKLKKSRPLDRLVCNAAVYQPALPTPKFTVDGHEEQLQINHLSHYLLCSLLITDLQKSKNSPRCIIVGSITGNSNTVGGGAVLPLADLGNLEGLAQGGKDPVAMIDGKAFNGAKAYKDSKVCNMMTVNELHKRYHKSTGITFGSIYPGCIATTQLFREKRQWFRTLFPLFMRYVTGGFVSEEEAGQRLAQVVDDPRCAKSGVYWSWNGGAKTIAYLDFSQKNGFLRGAGGSGGEIFENSPSDQVRDVAKGKKMWEFSEKITKAKWPAVTKPINA